MIRGMLIPELQARLFPLTFWPEHIDGAHVCF